MATLAYFGMVALLVFYTFRIPGVDGPRPFPIVRAKQMGEAAAHLAEDLQKQWVDAFDATTHETAPSAQADSVLLKLEAPAEWYVEGALNQPVLILEESEGYIF